MRVGAVTGLTAEALVAEQLGLLAEAGGGTAGGTDRAVARLIAHGVGGLVSFGIAGALAPNLATGTLVLPAALRAADGAAHWVALDWHARLVAAAQAHDVAAVVGGMLGADTAVATAAEKAALYGSTGAVAVDLESRRVAEAAARARIPFIILRAIADPAHRNLPPAAQLPLSESGRADLAAVLGSIARQPAQIPTLLRLGAETAQALWALFRGGRAIGAPLLHP
jgi:adenosylhomocysteine nucleosidase